MEVDLEEDHWVFDVLKKWVDGQLGAEVGLFVCLPPPVVHGVVTNAHTTH